MAGIAETNTIDIVAQDAAGEFLVIMVETRPWGSDPKQAVQLRNKINAYAGYILDGTLARHYPATAGRNVLIQLDCPQAPEGEMATITSLAAAKLAELGIGFRIHVRNRAG
jgi:hypothetical protein